MLVIMCIFMSLMYLSSIVCFVIQRQHLLMSLLALESSILVICMMFFTSSCSNELFILLSIFTFGACEASLGLACLVLMMRSFGSDMVKILSMTQC